VIKQKITLKHPVRIGVLGAAMICSAISAEANGLGESVSWQFRTSVERSNLAVVTDLIEKKKGGYYDGFDTTNYVTSTTNIGAQVNCNTVADATGNLANSDMGGSAPSQNASADIASDSVGNEVVDGAQEQSGSGASDQQNSGPIVSTVDDSSVLSTNGSVNTGDTDNILNNDQDNSGDQLATIDGSTTCDLSNSTLQGDVTTTTTGTTVSAGPLN